MEKMKLGLIFGGKSSENEVSLKSANTIYKNLDKNKYEISLIYISKHGKWIKCKDIVENAKLDLEIVEDYVIENIQKELEKLDKAFPILHGVGGEDGSIQGLFEMVGIPYVGCTIESSAIGMNKVLTKMVLENIGINVANYVYVTKRGLRYFLFKDGQFVEVKLSDVIEKIPFNFPVYVKPAKQGSSVGVSKVENEEELTKALELAFELDDIVLIEENLDGIELEVGVLESDGEIVSSDIAQIQSLDKFYTYDEKYLSGNSNVLIPANIDKEKTKEIQEIAKKVFQAVNAKDLIRCDFFLVKDKIYVNEINTMPGFTIKSAYPMLFEHCGVSLQNLLDKLII